MAIYLVRHAKAGDRRDWDGPGPDERRPLSRKGLRQAEGLVALLLGQGGEPPERILSSPHVRCVQTVEPLARAVGRPVEAEPLLAEGGDPAAAMKLLRELAGLPAVLCSHGDLIPALLDRLAADDGLALPPVYPVAKGSTWVLEAEGRRFVASRYLPPPS